MPYPSLLIRRRKFISSLGNRTASKPTKLVCHSQLLPEPCLAIYQTYSRKKKTEGERSLLLLCMQVAENGGKILWCFKTWFANHLSIWGALARQILVIISLSWLEKNEEVGRQNKLLGWNHKLALSLPCNAHRAPRRALLNPIFFLMNPHKGSVGSWVQEEDRGVQRPCIPSPSLQRVCHIEETRMHSAGAIKKTLTSLGPNIVLLWCWVRSVCLSSFHFLLKKP